RIAVELPPRSVDVERDGHAKLLVRSGFGAGGAGLDPRGDQRPELRLRAGCRLAAAARLPSPAHQRVLRHVLLDGRERLAAVALRVLDLLADLAERLALPCHRLRGDMPQRMARYTRLLIV